MRYLRNALGSRPMLRRRLTGLAGTVLAGGALAVAVAATPASVAASAHRTSAEMAGPVRLAKASGMQAAGLTTNELRLFAVQDRLDLAAKQILTAGGGGNASVVVDPQHAEMRVYWHGRVPARIRELADRPGVRIRFKPAAFTFNRLIGAEQKLAGLPGLVQAAPKPNGSGLNVTITRNASARDRAAIRAASPVPLTITTGAPLRLANSRQADVSPYWGGSRYETPLGGGRVGLCTNGFALTKPPPATPPPMVYELTAGHCGSNRATVDIPGQVSPTGVMQQKFACRDIIKINYSTSGGLVEGRIYTGNANSSTSVPVAGATFDTVGDAIVTGGATSGEHPDIKVTAVGVMAEIPGIACPEVYPLDEGVRSNDRCAAAKGDSGGPVYAYASPPTTVIGRGTITAIFGKHVRCYLPSGTFVDGQDSVDFAPLVSPPGSSYIGSLAWYGMSLLVG
jgi:hypothetical protein